MQEKMLSARLERGGTLAVCSKPCGFLEAFLWRSFECLVTLFFYGASSIFMEIAIALNSLFQPPHKDYGLQSSSTSSNFTARMNVLSKDLIYGLVEYINLSPEI